MFLFLFYAIVAQAAVLRLQLMSHYSFSQKMHKTDFAQLEASAFMYFCELYLGPLGETEFHLSKNS